MDPRQMIGSADPANNLRWDPPVVIPATGFMRVQVARGYRSLVSTTAWLGSIQEEN